MELLHLLLGLSFAAFACAAFVCAVFRGRPSRRSLKELVVGVCEALL